MHRITSHRFCPPDRQRSGRLVRCRMVWLLMALAASLLVFTGSRPGTDPGAWLAHADPSNFRNTAAPAATGVGIQPDRPAGDRDAHLREVVALLTILIYTYVAQRQFYAAAGKLGQAGQAVKAISVSSIARRTEGRACTTYSSKCLLASKALGWSPSESNPASTRPCFPMASRRQAPMDGRARERQALASIEGGSRGRVKVIAATVGAFTLSAEATYEVTEKDATTGNDQKTEKTATGSVGVAALAPEAKAVELPFIGQGYGAIAISVVLIAAVVVLGISNVLTGEGVATLLGGLLGYIFGVGVASNSNRKPANEG